MVFEHITLVELNNIEATEKPTRMSEKDGEAPVNPSQHRLLIGKVVAVVGMSIGIYVFATVLGRKIANRTEADEDTEEPLLKLAE